ncbi:hypothetical protein MMC20_006918 [Loxospora ochrophaea]|nr:hypothetical protein [Loxospora ochrophaea]
MAASIMKTITSQSSAKTADSQYNTSTSILWVEQNLVVIMGCVPPLRAVSKIQFPKLRSLGQSLIRIISITRSSRTESSSRFHDGSERSTYQHLELKDSHKQPYKESTPSSRDKDFFVAEVEPTNRNVAKLPGNGEIQRTDDYTVSYGRPTEPQQNV